MQQAQPPQMAHGRVHYPHQPQQYNGCTYHVDPRSSNYSTSTMLPRNVPLEPALNSSNEDTDASLPSRNNNNNNNNNNNKYQQREHMSTTYNRTNLPSTTAVATAGSPATVHCPEPVSGNISNSNSNNSTNNSNSKTNFYYYPPRQYQNPQYSYTHAPPQFHSHHQPTLAATLPFVGQSFSSTDSQHVSKTSNTGASSGINCSTAIADTLLTTASADPRMLTPQPLQRPSTVHHMPSLSSASPQHQRLGHAKRVSLPYPHSVSKSVQPRHLLAGTATVPPIQYPSSSPSPPSGHSLGMTHGAATATPATSLSPVATAAINHLHSTSSSQVPVKAFTPVVAKELPSIHPAPTPVPALELPAAPHIKVEQSPPPPPLPPPPVCAAPASKTARRTPPKVLHTPSRHNSSSSFSYAKIAKKDRRSTLAAMPSPHLPSTTTPTGATVNLSESPSSSKRNTRGVRIATSPHHKVILEHVFNLAPYPSQKIIDALEVVLEMERKRLRTWFQNSRQRNKTPTLNKLGNGEESDIASAALAVKREREAMAYIDNIKQKSMQQTSAKEEDADVVVAESAASNDSDDTASVAVSPIESVASTPMIVINQHQQQQQQQQLVHPTGFFHHPMYQIPQHVQLYHPAHGYSRYPQYQQYQYPPVKPTTHFHVSPTSKYIHQ